MTKAYYMVEKRLEWLLPNYYMSQLLALILAENDLLIMANDTPNRSEDLFDGSLLGNLPTGNTPQQETQSRT